MELVKSMKSKNWKNESKHKAKIKWKENSKNMSIKEEKWIKFLIKHKSCLVKFLKIKLKKGKK